MHNMIFIFNYLSSMKFQKLFIYILVFCWSVIGCQDSITVSSIFSTYSCNFRFQFNNNTCSFKSCSLKSTTQNKEFLSSWIQCYEQCCEPVQSQISQGDPNWMIKQCQDSNTKRKNLIIGLGIGLTFSVIALIIGMVACCKLQKCPLYKLTQSWNRKDKPKKDEVIVFAPIKDLIDAGGNISDLHVEDTSDHVTEVAIKSDVDRSLLNFELKKNMRLMRCKCSICQDIKPQCYLTSCNHYFHIDCINQWLQKHRLCPTCGAKNLKYVRVYCIDCRQDLKAIQVSKFMKKYKRSFVFRCKECNQQRV